MKVSPTEIEGSYLIDLDSYEDDRGFFLESFNLKKYSENGIPYNFVQDNHSSSCKGVIRGLHYQINRPTGHLIYVTRGCILDVGLDLRKNSSTFKRHITVRLSSDKRQQLFLPPGVAHGFCALGEQNEIWYKCTELYDPSDEAGVLWSDPDLAIDWPFQAPIIKSRDAMFPLLCEIEDSRLPRL